MLFFRKKIKRTVEAKPTTCSWRPPGAGKMKDIWQEAPAVPPKSSILRRIIFWLILLAFWGTAGYVVFFSPFLTVAKIEVTGTETLSRESIIGKTREIISGKYWTILPKDTLLVIFSENIEKSLADEFRRIKNIEVEKIFPDALKVTVEERHSLMVWCGRDRCLALDEEGNAFQEADFDSKEMKENNLVIVSDGSGEEAVLGTKILSPEIMGFIAAIRDGFDADSVVKVDPASRFVMPSRAAEEMTVKSVEGWNIIFSGNIPPADSLKALQLILKKELPAGTRQFLEYIDLRARNKVYYKFKEEEKPIEQTEQSGGE